MANALWNRFNDIASTRKTALAVQQGANGLTFTALHRAALAHAATLDQMGTRPGDRVLICAANSPDVLAWVAAIWHRGAIPTLLHQDAPSAHLAHARALTDPRVAVTSRDHDWPDDLAICTPDDDFTIARDIPDPAQNRADAPGSIVFTSGSSGLPKGVTQAGGTLIDGAARISALLDYSLQDRILCPVPFAFDYGWGQALSCLLEGITLILPEAPGGFATCNAISAHAPTVFAGVPAVYGDLTAGLAPVRTTARDSIRLLTNTGSKIPAPVWTELCALFPEAEISLNYGLTETYRSAALPVDLARSRSDSVGHAVPGVELCVLRPDGALAAPGEEGEIVHHGAGTFLGYWEDPVRTAEVLRPDPLGRGGLAVFTGDLGSIGHDGLLRIHGRRDRQMKSMGVRVSPDEVEAILLESDAVAEVGVIALPNHMLGDMIVACIVPSARDADASPPHKAIKKHLAGYARASMSPYMQPRRWEFFDALPRTRSAKVNYPELRKSVEARL